jgi:hypothetical protein
MWPVEYQNISKDEQTRRKKNRDEQRREFGSEEQGTRND